MRPWILAPLLLLTACSGVSLPPAPDLPMVADPRDQPFFPRDEYPVPPNVERLIGPEDCRGATLRAVEASVPDYPVRAYVNGRQGWAVVRFHVYEDGSTHRVHIARSVPDGPFNRAARNAVRDWRFQPLGEGRELLNCVVMFEFRAGEVRIR